jgi:hypothetical protein
MADHKDYTGTPLWRKLGIRAGARVYLAGPPAGFDDALEALAPLPDGVTFLRRPAKDLDVIVLGATRRAELERRFPALTRGLAPAGRLWVAWPKKAAGIDGDVDFAAVQELGLAAGLVDNKSASITEDFQGVQFVVRLADRARGR